MEASAPPRPAHYWPEVEAFYGQLPPQVMPYGILLRHNLAARFSAAGGLEGVFGRAADPPWLHLHFWMLDDWLVPAGEQRREVERRLFLAMAAALGAAFVRESRLDPETGFDDSARPLEDALWAEARAQLDRLFPPESPFWRYHQQFVEAWARSTAPATAASVEALLEHAQRRSAEALALGKIPAAAAAVWAGPERAAQLPDLLPVLDQVHQVVQALQETLGVRRDIRLGRLSYPIVAAMQAAGLAPDAPIQPERLLGAMLLTGAVRRIAEASLERLEGCQAAARAHGLPSLAVYLTHLAGRAADLKDLFSVRGGSQPVGQAIPLVFEADDGGLDQAVAMAEACLLADRTFRESWEVQRRGMFGLPELTGRVFAPGLILEALCQEGLDLSGEVGGLLDRMAAEGYRYYPHPALPPDADDLGLALRLLAWSAGRDRHAAQLRQPLRWMEANISAHGQIACWFTRGVDSLAGGPALLLWGNQCATVEAGLLLGLLAYDPAGYRPVIDRSAACWMERWETLGLGANALYTPAYALWMALRLLAALRARAEAGREDFDRALALLAERLRPLAGAAGTPQEAALLALACLHEPALPAIARQFDPAWIRLIVKRQRYDGSWPAEALYITPNRGETAAWYSSQLVTTALCWRALRVYGRLRESGGLDRAAWHDHAGRR